MKNIHLLLLALLLSVSAFSQSKQDKEKAAELGEQAIDLVDAGRYSEGILMLEKADKLDPKNSTYKYEIAYALYSQKKYKEANNILKSIIKKKDATSVYYQLLGNTYDILGDPGKAMDTYQAGLKKHPSSGNLYLEQGVIYMGQKKYNEAVAVFEKGVAAEPDYASNYYWLCKLYAGSNNEVYSIIYGEIFVNLERNSKRTRQISKLLYETYQSAITVGDTSVGIKFTKVNQIDKDGLELMKKGVMPFGIEFDMVMLLGSMAQKRQLDMAFMSGMRQGFVDQWFKKGNDAHFPNPLFDMWRTLSEKGHFEAYNYWLFLEGDPDGHDAWVEANKEQYDAFVEYFNPNPIQISTRNYFVANKR